MTDPAPAAGDVADRLAVRGLIDAWAHCADRRLPQQQAELFTEDGTISVHTGNPAPGEVVQQLRGHVEMAEAFTVLDTYDVTTHFTGQSVISFDGDRAVGETYCLAHHLWTDDGLRTLMIMSIRYLDTFARQDHQWRFADRTLVIDWTDKRSSHA
jgi:hypothetical protein